MVDKSFLVTLGERTGDQAEPDVLLQDTVSNRKKKQIERQDEIDEKKHLAEVARLDKEKAAAEAAVEKAESSPQNPFTFKGGVNFGTIDLQQQQRDLQTQLEKLRQDAETSARATGQENAILRDQLHAKEMEMVQNTLMIQIQSQNNRLDEMIKANASKGNVLEQIEVIKGTAAQLGMVNPSASTSDLMGQIELKKLEFQQTMELRKMSREEKRADREFQRQLQKDADERAFNMSKIEQEKKRTEMLTSAPETLGRAIARGLADSKKQNPVSSNGGKGYRIEAGWGDSGEIPCPNEDCDEMVGIGPTAKGAVCVNCGTKLAIKRVGEKPGKQAEESRRE